MISVAVIVLGFGAGYGVKAQLAQGDSSDAIAIEPLSFVSPAPSNSLGSAGHGSCGG